MQMCFGKRDENAFLEEKNLQEKKTKLTDMEYSQQFYVNQIDVVEVQIVFRISFSTFCRINYTLMDATNTPSFLEIGFSHSFLNY